MTWKRTGDLSGKGGTCLQIVLRNLRASTVRCLFGDPDPWGLVDDEKGYDGDEYIFVNEAGGFVFLYSRWGQYRIGASNHALAESFEEWLDSEWRKLILVNPHP
jgi:hypothetical protein